MTGDEYAAKAFYDRWKQTNVPWGALTQAERRSCTRRFEAAARARLTNPLRYYDKLDDSGLDWSELSPEDQRVWVKKWLEYLDALATPEYRSPRVNPAVSPIQHFELVSNPLETKSAADYLDNTKNPIDAPDYYTWRPIDCRRCDRRIECIDITRHLPYTLGNPFKYIYRLERKDDPVKQLYKALWHLVDEDHHVKDSYPEIHPYCSGCGEAIHPEDVIPHFPYHLGMAIYFVWHLHIPTRPGEYLHLASEHVQSEIVQREADSAGHPEPSDG